MRRIVMSSNGGPPMSDFDGVSLRAEIIQVLGHGNLSVWQIQSKITDMRTSDLKGPIESMMPNWLNRLRTRPPRWEIEYELDRMVADNVAIKDEKYELGAKKPFETLYCIAPEMFIYRPKMAV